jgi:hypothetical protein
MPRLVMARRARLTLLAAVCGLAGCGYVGNPLPPSLNIPLRVTDLSAVEHGAELRFRFTIPALTTDGAGLRVGQVELRVGPAEGDWANQSRHVEVTASEPGPAHAETPVAGLAGQDLVAAVRVAGRSGRFSGWSNQVRFQAVAPLGQPRDIRVAAVPEGVRVSWTDSGPVPGLEWRVLRRLPDQTEPVVVGSVTKPEFIDTATHYGIAYEYSAQSTVKIGGAEAESEISPVARVTPEDVFSPSVPSAVTAVAGLGNVQLSWNPDPELDLRGYFVYRSVEGGAFARVGGEIPEPAYTDRGVEPGKRYRYAVSAVDQRGNESARSEPVEVTAQ